MLNSRQRQRSKKRAINEINMVPFIDVMLVLLVIFMITAPLIVPSMIDLPSIGKASQQPTQVVEVLVKQENNFTVKFAQTEQQVNLENLLPVIRQLSPTAEAGADPAALAIVISANKAVPYEAVIAVMDQLQQADFKRIGLSVKLNN